MDHCVISYGLIKSFLTDIETRLSKRFWVAMPQSAYWIDNSYGIPPSIAHISWTLSEYDSHRTGTRSSWTSKRLGHISAALTYAYNSQVAWIYEVNHLVSFHHFTLFGLQFWLKNSEHNFSCVTRAITTTHCGFVSKCKEMNDIVAAAIRGP